MSYDLKNESIDSISEEITERLKSLGIKPRIITRIRLAAEDILLKYQDKLSEDSCVEISTEKRFNYNYLTLSVNGEKFDPFENENEEDILLHNVLEKIGYMPDWNYEKESNLITFSIKKKEPLPSWLYIVIAALLGITCGFVSYAFPDKVRNTITDTVLSPISSSIMGFLGAVSVIMVFLSIINGICGMGNITTFNKIGKKMLGRFTVWLLVAAALIGVVVSFLFNIGNGSAKGVSLLSLWKMMLDIIPTNIIDAFYKGNTLQVVFLAAVMGVVTLSIIRKMHSLTEWTEQLSTLIQALVDMIVKVMPVVVFISLFNIIAKGEVKNFAKIYKFPLYVLIITTCWLAFMFLRTAITQKVNVFVLMKKLLPSFIIAISTASSSATLSENMDICEKKLGISKQIVNVGVPLSQSLFKPGSVITDMLGVMCMAEIYKIEITWSMLIMLLFVTFILSFATPSSAGAPISIFTLLFAQFGIPAQAITVIIALDAIVDRMTTPGNVLSEVLELVQTASSLGKIDRDILRKK